MTSLNGALLFAPNFLSAFRLELICISFIVNSGRASFISMAGSVTAIAHRNSSFVQVNSVNPLCLKAQFSQTSNHCMIILEAVKLAYAN